MTGVRLFIVAALFASLLAGCDNKSGAGAAPPPPPVTGTELAWLAKDDPLPFLAMWPRLAKPLASARHDHGRAKNATDGAR